VTAGVEFIDENGVGGPDVEVVNQSYEADHDAPTRPLHGTIEKARSGGGKNWCSQDPLLTASEPTAR
jgi:hypothetical protein